MENGVAAANPPAVPPKVKESALRSAAPPPGTDPGGIDTHPCTPHVSARSITQKPPGQAEGKRGPSPPGVVNFNSEFFLPEI